ncbi:hypothetical protein [uncultured Martelella sp.]|uniref:hypothetical protein n=1 Tax=uncultured Martelella sp. TaxID=392331 RepID=UPI0029C73135|nr:hypothetical protein [uncultured Martelella sp.]
MKINGSRDCGNSPKNRIVQDIAVAIETGDLPESAVTDSTVWHRADGSKLKGAASLRCALDEVLPADSIIVDHSISHGKAGAANGVSVLADGRTRRFCHVVEFTSVKATTIAEINSY